MNLRDTLQSMGRSAREAAEALRVACAETRTEAIGAMAGRLRAHAPRILAANAEDVAAASGMIDRLRLDAGRVEAIAHSLDEVAALPEPPGVEMDRWSRPNGLDIASARTPNGLSEIIYDIIPTITSDH